MDAPTEFWRNWHAAFEEDDGSLPEFRLRNLPLGAVREVWHVLRSRSHDIAPATLWRRDLGREVPLGSGLEAADLVAEGKVASFHALLRGITSRGVKLPDLGVTCDSEEVALDYRGGPHWNERSFLALLGLLNDLVAVAPGSHVTPEEGMLDQYRNDFRRAFDSFRASTSA